MCTRRLSHDPSLTSFSVETSVDSNGRQRVRDGRVETPKFVNAGPSNSGTRPPTGQPSTLQISSPLPPAPTTAASRVVATNGVRRSDVLFVSIVIHQISLSVETSKPAGTSEWKSRTLVAARFRG